MADGGNPEAGGVSRRVILEAAILGAAGTLATQFGIRQVTDRLTPPTNDQRPSLVPEAVPGARSEVKGTLSGVRHTTINGRENTTSFSPDGFKINQVRTVEGGMFYEIEIEAGRLNQIDFDQLALTTTIDDDKTSGEKTLTGRNHVSRSGIIRAMTEQNKGRPRSQHRLTVYFDPYGSLKDHDKYANVITPADRIIGRLVRSITVSFSKDGKQMVYSAEEEKYKDEPFVKERVDFHQQIS